MKVFLRSGLTPRFSASCEAKGESATPILPLPLIHHPAGNVNLAFDEAESQTCSAQGTGHHRGRLCYRWGEG